VSGQDVTSPGYGIPTFEGTEEELPGVDTILEAQADGARLPATAFSTPHHERSGSGATSTFAGERPRAQSTQRGTERVPVRPSPASRIPVRTRRLSATSDSTTSSSRSVKYTPTRASNHSNRASPTRFYRKSMGAGSVIADSHGADQSILPSLAYRGHREREKSPVGSRNAPGVSILTSAPPLSPRLRNSRERQPLSPGPSSRTSGAHGEQGYFPNSSLDIHHNHSAGSEQASDPKDDPFVRVHDTHQHSEQPHDEHQNSLFDHQQRLSLQTSQLSIPPTHQPLSATTDFEESPILGLPGSFVLTPPTAHEEPQQQQQLLQPTIFHAPVREQPPMSPDVEQSELGVRESIPIMLGDAQSSEPWRANAEDIDEGLQALTYGYTMDQGYTMNGLQPASHYDRDDSPIDPFGNRDSLRPEDSASIAPYRAAGPITFNSETYSVVNSVLNMYHQSPVISPELASVSRERVQQVSPVIAQHKDWGSKEATETYLARLLSDANGARADISMAQMTTSPSRPDVSSSHEEEDMHGFDVGGTAIIYPSQSRRYSRGSRGSTTTTIQDDASRSGSSSGNLTQDQTMQSTATDLTSPNAIELPQLAWTNGGLGLSYHHDLPPSPSSQRTPPRPAYSPPPPPVKPSIDQHTSPITAPHPPVSHQYPRPAAINEHIELHPARAITPVSHDDGLEARYGAPTMAETDQAAALRTSAESGQPDPAKQALIKRYRILEELLTTEHQFCIDMMIAHNIFEATAQGLMTEKEKKILFSNCKELEKFSLSLFRAFKKAAKPIVNYDIPPPTGPWNRDSSDSRPSNRSDPSLQVRRPSEDSQNQFENCTLENDHLTAVGQVFLDNKEKMERLYTTYYLNQENAAAYIKKHQSNPELTGWVAACFEQVENMTQAWDLDSLLLKPCQRLLKYPLLLDGLETSSDPDHPDLHNIKAARKELLAMSARINEAKKRADTFRAATSEGKKEKTKGKGIGKTFVKAFIPKVDKNKAYDEADKTFKDQDYKSREQKFGGHFFQLQIVIRDFEQYLDAITEHYQQLNIVFLGFVSVCEVAPSVHPELESTWRKWAMAHFELQNKALEDHVSACACRATSIY
jgi:dynamin-binding protein